MNARRRWILQAAGAGLALDLVRLGRVLAAGAVEGGIHRVSGEVRVNGAQVGRGTQLKPGDTVTTGANGEIVFVVGRDAILVRASSRVELVGKDGSLVLAGLRMLTGRMLSVFTPGEAKRIQASTATIGIRGTAVYIESEPDRTYVCTCYGTAELAASDDPAARETVTTTYHDQPRYIMAKGAPQMLMKAPVVNHTDAELVMLEALVGRKPPFWNEPNRY